MLGARGVRAFEFILVWNCIPRQKNSKGLCSIGKASPSRSLARASSDSSHCCLGHKFLRAQHAWNHLGALGSVTHYIPEDFLSCWRLQHIYSLWVGREDLMWNDAEFLRSFSQWLVHLADIYWASRVPSAGVRAREGPYSWSLRSRWRTQMIK